MQPTSDPRQQTTQFSSQNSCFPTFMTTHITYTRRRWRRNCGCNKCSIVSPVHGSTHSTVIVVIHGFLHATQQWLLMLTQQRVADESELHQAPSRAFNQVIDAQYNAAVIFYSSHSSHKYTLFHILYRATHSTDVGTRRLAQLGRLYTHYPHSIQAIRISIRLNN